MQTTDIMPYIIIYTCVWWILFYISLPIAITPASKKIESGHADSAPEKSFLWVKFIIVTIASFPLSWVVKYFVDLI